MLSFWDENEQWQLSPPRGLAVNKIWQQNTEEWWSWLLTEPDTLTLWCFINTQSCGLCSTANCGAFRNEIFYQIETLKRKCWVCVCLCACVYLLMVCGDKYHRGMRVPPVWASSSHQPRPDHSHSSSLVLREKQTHTHTNMLATDGRKCEVAHI